jgi:hypothetical protein
VVRIGRRCPESQKIAGLIAFYNEKPGIYVDGDCRS